MTEPTQNDSQNEGSPPKATPPAADTSGADALAKQLADAQKQLAELGTQVKTLEGEKANLAKANEQALSQVETAKAEAKTAADRLAKLTNDLTATTQQIATFQSQVTEKDEALAAATTKLNIYDVIQTDPSKYAGALPAVKAMAEIISPTASVDKVKEVLDGFSTGAQSLVDQKLATFARGGSPGGGGGADQTNQGPKDAAEAWYKLQELDPVKQPKEYQTAMASYQRLVMVADKAQN